MTATSRLLSDHGSGEWGISALRRVSVFRGFARGSALMLAVVGAHPAGAETLAQAVYAAYFGNPTILAQRAQLRALNERYVQARGAFGFSADASIAYQTQHAAVGNTVFDSLTGVPAVATQSFNASTQSETFTVVQPLYSGGRNHAALQGAMANIFVGYQNVRREEARILEQVIDAYVDVQRDQQIVGISEENLKLLLGQVDQTRAELAVKEATLTDRDQGFARLAAGQAQIVLARSHLQNSESTYRALVGHDPDQLAPPPSLPEIAATLDAIETVAEESSPLLLAAEYQERSSRAGILAAKAETRPTISLRGDVNQGPLLPYDSQLKNNNQTLQVVMSIPIFSSGQTSSRIREARDLNDSDADQLEDARRQVKLTVSQAWEQMHSNLQAQDLYDKQVEAQSGVYKGTKLEQRYALRSTLDILNAAQELNNARINRANAAHDAYAGRVALLGASGRLEPGLFGIVVPRDLLDPDLHLLDKRDTVLWVGLFNRIDAIGQENVVRP